VDKVYLEKATDSSVEWTDKWQMKLNTNKCKIISIHHRRYSDKGVLLLYVMDKTTLEVVDGIKDLGVYYDSLLLFDKHLSEKVNKAYMMLGIIKRNFEYISKNCFVMLCKSLW